MVVHPLVSADWLAAHLDDPNVRVVEVDVSPASYRSSHLPGAVLWDIYKMLKDPRYRLVDRATTQEMFEHSGIGPQTHVVLYGYGPALGYWLLKLYRHENASILNLSKARWAESGRPMTADPPTPLQSSYTLPDPDTRLRAFAPDVEAMIGSDDCAIFDIRSAEEHSGERFWPSGAPEPDGRAGRIPGATRVAPERLVNADGSFPDADALRAAFPDLGCDGEIITYCTIGGRASLAWFALTELLGRPNVRVYDGSWAEWGHLGDVPVATGD